MRAVRLQPESPATRRRRSPEPVGRALPWRGVGIRTKIVPDLDSSISAFYIHQDFELIFNGDTGTTTPGPPSLRKGIEITNDYRPLSWFHIDFSRWRSLMPGSTDSTPTKPRFTNR